MVVMAIGVAPETTIAKAAGLETGIIPVAAPVISNILITELP